MTQEEKDLLLKDLCTRLLYGVKVNYYGTILTLDRGLPSDDELENGVKPYLRPMLSITEEENKQRKELNILLWSNSNGERGLDGFGNISGEDVLKAIDWLNVHHFDYRGLIEKGLALEATEGMYNMKQEEI